MPNKQIKQLLDQLFSLPDEQLIDFLLKFEIIRLPYKLNHPTMRYAYAVEDRQNSYLSFFTILDALSILKDSEVMTSYNKSSLKTQHVVFHVLLSLFITDEIIVNYININFSDLARDLARDLDRNLALVRDIACDLARVLALASDRVLDLDRDFVHNLALARDLARDLDLARVIDLAGVLASVLASARSRDRDRVLDIDVERDMNNVHIDVKKITFVLLRKILTYYKYSQHEYNLLVQCVESVKKTSTNQNMILSNIIQSEAYKNKWSACMDFLRKDDYEYFADLYTDVIHNNFIMDKEKLHNRMSIPNEIIGSEIFAYIEQLERIDKEGAEFLNEARIIILGDKGAGKTTLAKRLLNTEDEESTVHESTIGVDRHLWEVGDTEAEDKMKVWIWDFAGNVVMHAIHKYYLSGRCLYILVYDGRTENRDSLRYWLEHVENYGGDSKVMILANEKDDTSTSIDPNQLKEDYGDRIVDIKTLAIRKIKDDQANKSNFITCRDDIIRYIKDNPTWSKSKISKSTYQVKQEIENLFTGTQSTRKEYIKKEVFDKIVKKYNIKDEHVETLLKNLQNLGIVFCYEEYSELKTIVLNPEWISNAIYMIINWLAKQKRHEITLKDLEEVYSEESNRYPEETYPYIFLLLEKHELGFCIRTAHATEEKTMIVTQLLPVDKPEELPKFEIDDSLMVSYHAERFLPPNLISRFIVKHHKEIKNDEDGQALRWRYGVVLHKDNIQAMIRQDRKINMLTLYVKGKNANHRKDYLVELQSTLNALFEEFKASKPEMQYYLQGSNPSGDSYGVEANALQAHIYKQKDIQNIITGEIFKIPKITQQYGKTLNIINIHGNNSKAIIETGNKITINFKQSTAELETICSALALELLHNNSFEDAKEFSEFKDIFSKLKNKDPIDIQAEEKEKIKKFPNILRKVGNTFSKVSKIANFTHQASELYGKISPHVSDIAQQPFQ